MKTRRIMNINKDTVYSIRSIAVNNETNVSYIIEDVLSKYNKESLEENKNSINKLPKQPTKYLDDSNKESVAFYIKREYYKLLKFSARLESKTIGQKMDEILGDYIAKIF